MTQSYLECRFFRGTSNPEFKRKGKCIDADIDVTDALSQSLCPNCTHFKKIGGR